jgi:aldehyde:ferredoxin oxidoreductase
MPYAFCNKILRVDLTTGKITVDEPGEAFYRKYLGGTALAMHYLLNEMPAHADPLGPENLLVLSIGVLTGAPISGQSRIMANAKSPLTGGIGDSQGGGFWPAELKFAGFDAIVFKGKSPKPVYLWIHDGQAELRDASHLWGKGTGYTEDKIQEELGDKKIRIAGIGQGGENMVKVAAIINFKSRACGRTGMGAVMGSKNLKCVAIRGTQKYQTFNRDALTAIAREGLDWRKIDLGQQNFTKYGTSGGVTFQQEVGDLPTRNWSSGVFEDWKNLTGENMVETIMIHNDTCYGCAVRCKRVVEVKPGVGKYTVDPAFGGPEYETVATLGSYCGIGDLVAVAKGNELCNDYGLDTIGAGAAIAFAMDCYEHGILTKAETGGLDLKFGNGDAMVKLVEMIAKREGIGDILAEGSDLAAKKIGKGAEQYSVTCKGNAFPAHMPQFKRSLGLIYAVNPYGADHQTSEHDHAYSPAYGGEEGLRRMTSLGLNSPRPPMVLDEEKVRFALYTQYIYNALNCAGTCQFVWGGTWQTYGVTPLPRALSAVTGWDFNVWELMKVGERSLNMMRVFNVREGFDARHDILPPKVYVPLKGGATDGVAVDKEEFEQAKKLYYQMAGWDTNGVPTRAKLVELDIPWTADLIGK